MSEHQTARTVNVALGDVDACVEVPDRFEVDERLSDLASMPSAIVERRAFRADGALLVIDSIDRSATDGFGASAVAGQFAALARRHDHEDRCVRAVNVAGAAEAYLLTSLSRDADLGVLTHTYAVAERNGKVVVVQAIVQPDIGRGSVDRVLSAIGSLELREGD